MKKLLTFLGLALGAVIGLSFAVGLGTYAAHRDNRKRCDAPLDQGAIRELSIELPEGAQVCRKTQVGDGAALEILVESPGPVCFLSAGQLGCPSMVKSEIGFITSMAHAGWDAEESPYDKNGLRFLRAKGESASARFDRSRYGEISGSMHVTLPSSKVGKQ